MRLELGDNTHKSLTIEIMVDDQPESPRDWDNLGTMTCNHGRYQLGDTQDQTDIDGLLKHLNKVKRSGGVYLPLYLYDHSGITMATTPFSCPWDSGQVGWIHVTGEKIRREYCVERISKIVRGHIVSILTSEVELYNQYLQNEVYGYVVKNEDGIEFDSCWGFYGIEEVSRAAIEAADYELKEVA